MYTTLSITTDTLSVAPALSLAPPQPADLSIPLCILVSPSVLLPEALPAPLTIAQCFAEVPDPRHRYFRKIHILSDILVIALTAILCGCKSWEGIAGFGTAKETWFRSLGLQLPNGIPSHDAFRDIFARMDPLAFQNAFTTWIGSVCDTLNISHIPIDGKTLRGTRGPDRTCLHLVSAWAVEHRLTLAQIAVQDKSNEITAIPKLLQMLDVKGALVSIDAMGCQKEIAKQIRAGEGDYLLAVKDNQPTLHAEVITCFDNAFNTDFAGVKHEFFVMEEVNHGRYEERTFTVIYEPEGLSTKDEWVDLKAIVRVIRIRRVGDKESIEVAYFISSSTAEAKVLAEATRNHWSIENNQHWVLDVVFGEDRCRSNHGHAAENLAWLRKMALSLFSQDERKGTFPTRQIQAAADDQYRRHLLNLLGVKSS
jgi:predicted transposase YbfD/YdcC